MEMGIQQGCIYIRRIGDSAGLHMEMGIQQGCTWKWGFNRAAHGNGDSTGLHIRT